MMTFSSAFENLGFKSLKIVISMWSLIRPCWVDFFPRINTHVDMAIRATRVAGNFYPAYQYQDILKANFEAPEQFKNTRFQVLPS